MNEIRSEDRLPLAGRRILVTRSIHQASKLVDGLRALGAEPIEVPVLAIRPPDSFEPLDEAIRHFDRFDWLLLTSANAAEVVASRCARYAIRPGWVQELKVAVVGQATAQAARHYGFRVEVVPSSFNSEGIVAELSGVVEGQRVLLPRAKVARDVIPEALTAAGAILTIVDAYQTVLPEGSELLLAKALDDGLDAVTFTSSSSAQNLAEVARRVARNFPFAGVKAISIGPVTSATLREFGWEPEAEAGASDIPGLLEAVRQGIGNRE